MIAFNAAGCILWTSVFTTVGYLFGKNLPLVEKYIREVGIALAVIAIASDDVGSATPATTPSVVTIVGPAHPLGAPSVGIPCDELVFTRC